MKITIFIISATLLCLLSTEGAIAQSYLPEMSGGCAAVTVEVVSGASFHYVLWQKDRDTLGTGQQVRDDKAKIMCSQMRSMRPGYSWGAVARGR